MIKVANSEDQSAQDEKIFGFFLVFVVLAGPCAIFMQYARSGLRCLCQPFTRRFVKSQEEVISVEEAQERYLSSIASTATAFTIAKYLAEDHEERGTSLKSTAEKIDKLGTCLDDPGIAIE